MPRKREQVRLPDAAPTAAVWRSARFEIDEGRRELRVGGRPVELESKPFDLLLMLARHGEQVVTRESLLETVWRGRVLSDSALAKCVSKLRMALGDERQETVLTVHGIGYRLGLPVQRVTAAAAPAAEPPAAPQAATTPAAGALLSLVLGQAIGTIRYGDSLGARIRAGDALEIGAALEGWLQRGAAAGDTPALLEQAAAMIEARFGARPEIYGPTSLNLAAGLQNLGRRDTAQALLLRALKRIETQASPLTLDLRVQLADLSLELGQYDEAERLLRQVMIEAEAWYGSRSTAMLDARQGLAALDLEREHAVQAEERLRALLADVERWYPQNEERASTVRWQLARALLLRGELDEAGQLLDSVIRRWGLRFDLGSAVYHELRLSVSLLRRLQGRLDEAQQIVDQLLQRTATSAPETHRVRLLALQQRALLALRRGQAEQARHDLESARADSLRYFGATHPQTQRIAVELQRLQ
ncbi:hypothetical protein D0B54_22810 [Solimonas sp. K1W22B-7]|uniref:winged helix-turn-helix domain-containing protein n=1 Tax=Solimonas sp. K1W22B-7 TaxID=2303331 RepID=UPI000E330789|nr:winged helix-turn-helix domain-containing protein [Solimonas sp. K1W22B-7]AXQ31340.1 hypothetical protein D0B54_22810 [Solimonas sp. K1W22B-7]